MLCSSPIAARGPHRRRPSSRRDPQPAPGSAGSGSPPLAAALLLPGPSSGAGTPQAPSGEPVLPGRSARAAGSSSSFSSSSSSSGAAGHRLGDAEGLRLRGPGPHAGRGGAAVPRAPGGAEESRERGGDRQSRAIPVPAAGRAAGEPRVARPVASPRGGRAVGSGWCPRGRGGSWRPPSPRASPRALLPPPHPTPLAHTSQHVHTRAGTRAYTRTHSRVSVSQAEMRSHAESSHLARAKPLSARRRPLGLCSK